MISKVRLPSPWLKSKLGKLAFGYFSCNSEGQALPHKVGGIPKSRKNV